jgi:hypothetical protein
LVGIQTRNGIESTSTTAAGPSAFTATKSTATKSTAVGLSAVTATEPSAVTAAKPTAVAVLTVCDQHTMHQHQAGSD